jgi:phosphate transport system permease protein
MSSSHASAVTAETVSARARLKARKHGNIGDPLFRSLTRLAALIVFGILVGIAVALAFGAAPAFRAFGPAFFVTSAWNPVEEHFGALAPACGTLITSAIALLLAVPISFGIAIFLTELAPKWMRRPVGTAVELLAAVPSIVYGMWGLFAFAPFYAAHIQPALTEWLAPIPGIGGLFDGPPLGIGLSTAGIILAIMVVPFIAAVMRDVFETVPPMLREAAYGTGATTWEVVWKVVLPYARGGVLGGIVLGLGRALGETMAVTFVIGNAYDITLSLFMPSATISSVIANEFTEATGKLYYSSLIALGLVLFVITFIVLGMARLMLARMKARAGGA